LIPAQASEELVRIVSREAHIDVSEQPEESDEVMNSVPVGTSLKNLNSDWFLGNKLSMI
jgi:hypothetical protein